MKSGEIDRPDRVGSYFLREKWPLLIVMVSGIFYNVGLAVLPLLEGKLAQCLYEILKFRETPQAMLRLAGLYLLAALLVQGMRYLKRFYVRRFANNVGRSMKRILYRNLVHKNRAELEQESVGGMMTRAIADVDACAEGMRKFTTEVFDTGVVMLSYVVVLLAYDWRLTLLVSLFPPVAFYMAARLKKRVARSAAAYKESAGRLNGATLDRVSGALTYRVFGLEERRDAAYEEHLAAYEKRAVAVNLWETSLPPLYQILSMLGTVLILWLGTKNVQGTGWTPWDIAAFTTFLSCFTKLSVKASKAAKLFNAVQKAQVSWKRICPLLKKSAETPQTLPAPGGPLEVSHLTFSYPGGRNILQDVSFAALPGQIIGVTGPVACGKSTLGKAFLCETPYGGSIRFNGRELSELTRAQLCGVVGYLGHEPELLSDTLRENVLLGSEGSAALYLRAVALDEEIAAMPDGENTAVGDGGVRLSGGQCARLALARTLFHMRPLLILDDPFSAVDRTTEETILKNLRQLAKDSVVILISHRLDLFSTLDQVLWMEEGHTLFGTHEELLGRCEEYGKLYASQTKGGREHA